MPVAEDTSIRITDLLTEEQRDGLAALGRPVSFPAGQTIFWEGQPSHSALLIQQGNLKVTKTGPDGMEIILAIRGAVELMGEEGVLMAEPRSATVTPITEVKGLDIAGDDLMAFVDEHGLWPPLYRAAVRRGRQSDERLRLGRLDVKSRLARWLLELAKDVGEEADEGWVIETTLSQQDIAGRIGSSRDAVAIELGKFRRSGWLTTGRRRMVLHDLEALRRVSSN